MTASTRFPQQTVEEVKMPSSWGDYVTMVMTDSGFVSQGAIYGLDGRRWATSNNFDIRSDDVKTIVQGFLDPSKLWTGGIRIGCRSYTCTRAELGLLVGRESSDGTGCVIYKCHTCVLIGVHNDGVLPGGCYNVIVKLGEYLKDQGI